MKKYVVSVVLLFYVLLLISCGTENSDEINDNFTTNNIETNNSFMSLSDIQGDVLEFSDKDCVISPITYSADGSEAVISASGDEDSDTNVTIHYQNDCVFQIARISISSGETSFVDADISDIKKQSSVAVYGDWMDTYHLNAKKVILIRYE